MTFREIVGVIHIHTVHSDGTGTVEQITRAANRQGLDFLILTDHNTLAAQGREGWHGRTLLLVGEEISTGGGHYLAFRLPKEIPPRKEPAWTMDQVSASGGLGFIPHPFWKNTPWKGPTDHGCLGIEIYNAADDASSKRFPLFPVLGTILAGSDFSISQWLSRPIQTLAFWDRLLSEGRRLVGIGGADAHGLRWMGLRLAPYSSVFKLVRNHLLIEGDLTPSAVYRALEQGHLFVAHDVLADAVGFQFLAVREGEVLAILGDEISRQEKPTLCARLPSPGDLFLFRNGQVVSSVSGQELTWNPVESGAYRIEARRKGRPWIYSNPIYVIE